MASRFVVKKVTKLSDLKEGDEIPTSDFSTYTSTDEFLQFEYKEDKKEELAEIKPGIWCLKENAMGQIETHSADFLKEDFLEDYDHTKHITDRVDKFFEKIPVYHKFGMFPKRGVLLWGVPGTGKSRSIAKAAEKYNSHGDTAVVIWPTSALEAYKVKDFFTDVVYTGVSKLIFVVEDIGGAEYVGGKMAVKSSLLALLDNTDKTWTIPTLILATTNYPENLIQALTNRPQRFDDIIEVKAPSSELRSKLLAFFGKAHVTTADCALVAKPAFEGLSVAHMKEIVIRSAVFDISVAKAAGEVLEQFKKANKDFASGGGTMGIYVEQDY